MTKRKFSSKRLYRLIEIIVRVLSVILVAAGLLLLISFYTRGEEGTLSRLKFCDEAFNKEDKTSLMLNINCHNSAWDYHAKWERYGWLFTGGGVALMVLFYGGTRLFEYLFPKVKGENGKI